MPINPLNNEKELLLRIADGDDRAFADLFRAYYEPLSQFVFTLVDSVEICEEIVQDIFVKIWENRLALPNLDKFTSYLFILTRNYTMDHIRKSVNLKKRSQLYADDVLQISKSEDSPKLDEEYQDLLKRAIAELPPSQQKVLLLRQQGLKTREIAEKMGISRESVKKYQQWASSSVAKFIKTHTALGIVMMIIRSKSDFF